MRARLRRRGRVVWLCVWTRTSGDRARIIVRVGPAVPLFSERHQGRPGIPVLWHYPVPRLAIRWEPRA